MSIFKELKRRKVFKVGIAYVVIAWLVAQVLELTFDSFGTPDWVMKTVLVLLATGMPFALFYAWAFEITPDGVKRTDFPDGADVAPPPASGSSATPSETSTETVVENAGKAEAPVSASVAVLPFVNMSGDKDNEYFSDGLSEELLNVLAKVNALKVAARTSSFHFKDKNLPIPEIAATLGVDHVVEGSVRRSGDRVRITAQLIRASDGFHLWSNTYDRTLEDVFAVQEDIAGNIAETLDVVLNDDKREMMKQAGIGNVEAFIAYQKGMAATIAAHSTSDPGEGLPEANRYFDEALAIVPGISNAYFESTDMYGHIIYNHGIGVNEASDTELESALAAILNGLKLAARYTQSESLKAVIEAERAEFSDDWSAIPAALDRAFQSNSCIPTNWSNSLAEVFGWSEQLTAHFKNMMRCDPMSSLMVFSFGQAAIWAGQPEIAFEAATRHINEVGFNSWLDDVRFLSLLASGAYRDHPGMYDENPDGSIFDAPRSIYVYAMENDITTARQILDAHLEKESIDDINSFAIEAILGNREAANAYASKLDARFAGPFILAEVVKSCFCGAPFDLDVTPNFKARIEEAGFAWPPPTPINFPAKDW